MGRTNPTFRRQLDGIEERWGDYRRALRRRDQEHFDALFEYAREHADAAGYLNRDRPLPSILFSVALGQERRRRELEAQVEDLSKRVDALSRRVEELEARGEPPESTRDGE
ncbi:hypothetical protein [Halorientalis halophila]|uniref:hypothetical protein n=1 Tax=Halorientalis halophila TaxID=3108499 RepID=UPI0030096C39